MISNHVPINVTTNVHSNNTNTVVVHLNGGQNCKTEQTSAGVSVVKCEEEVVKREAVVQEEKPKLSCCEVVSPRICSKRRNDWQCYHRKTQQCGSFCTNPKIYLKPPQPVYQPSYMVMQPMIQPQPMPQLQIPYYPQSYGKYTRYV